MWCLSKSRWKFDDLKSNIYINYLHLCFVEILHKNLNREKIRFSLLSISQLETWKGIICLFFNFAILNLRTFIVWVWSLQPLAEFFGQNCSLIIFSRAFCRCLRNQSSLALNHTGHNFNVDISYIHFIAKWKISDDVSKLPAISLIRIALIFHSTKNLCTVKMCLR